MPDVDDTAERDSLRRRALAILSGDIESRVWQAFWRCAVEDESPADVAECLQMTVWSVYKARARVLQRLREEFADLVD